MSKKSENPRPTIHDYYNPPPKRGKSFVDHPSKTIQAFKAECDINKLVERAVRTGMPLVTTGMAREALFADVSGVECYEASLDAIRTAQEGFMTLPAAVRDRFGNDPAQLLAYIDQGGNLEEVLNPPPVAPGAPPADRPSA